MIDTLKQCVLFRNSSDADIESISRLITSKEIEEGEALAVSGERATSFYIVVSGTFLLEMNDGKALILDRTGDFAGLDILSRKGIYCSDLMALTSGKVIVVKRNDLLDIIQDDTPQANQIMHEWSQYLAEQIPFFHRPDETELLDYQY